MNPEMPRRDGHMDETVERLLKKVPSLSQRMGMDKPKRKTPDWRVMDQMMDEHMEKRRGF